MQHADSKQQPGEADLKLQVSHGELAAFVGEEAVRRLDALFRGYGGGGGYTVWVRRVEAVPGGRCINFHTDVSRRTMQVIYRGTSLIRNHPILGPYSRPRPRFLRLPGGGGRFVMGEVPLQGAPCVQAVWGSA